MEIFVNELSLHSQFSTPSEFLVALKDILLCRAIAEKYTHVIYCPRSISQRPATATMTFQQAVQHSRNPDIIRTITRWLDKHGPFWDDTRMHPADEWFDYEQQVVTDYTLGEAAYRMMNNIDVALVSFQPSMFIHTPLTVFWKISETTIYPVKLINFWLYNIFEQHCLTYHSPVTSWQGLTKHLQSKYTHLTFLDSINDGLIGEPFNLTIAKQIETLIGVLDKLKTCFDSSGSMTDEGHKIIQDFFHGDRAKFSDESESNKHKFRDEMTFKEPNGEPVFCPYHGKINYRFFRIHFSWPIRYEDPTYIAYIGPKITKA